MSLSCDWINLKCSSSCVFTSLQPITKQTDTEGLGQAYLSQCHELPSQSVIYVFYMLEARVVYPLSVRTRFVRPGFDALKQGTQLLVAQPVRSRALNTGGPLHVP